MRKIIFIFIAIVVVGTCMLIAARCSAEASDVTNLVKDKIQLESDGDMEGLWLLHSPAYLNTCSYESFAAYQTRKTAELQAWLGEGDLYTTVIEVEISGDTASVRYEIAAEGNEERGFARWDCFLKQDGVWYDMADTTFDPGYNAADDYILGIGVNHYIWMQASQQDNVLTLTNLYASLNQSTIYDIDNAPRNERGAINLSSNESVRIPGPPVSFMANISIGDLIKEGYPYTTEVYLEGFKIDINSALTYKIAIDGYDGALELASVKLTKSNSSISSSFILTAVPWYAGMCNASVISVLDKTELDCTPPIPLEINIGNACQE